MSKFYGPNLEKATGNVLTLTLIQQLKLMTEKAIIKARLL